MRLIRTLAVTAAMLAMVPGCGDEGSGTQPGGNQAPVADFEPPSCIVGAPCSFTSTSTDDVAVTEWSWDFDGDGIPDATGASASFIYSTAMTVSVTLRVRDAEGLSHSRTRPVTASPPGSGAPVADFTAEPCAATLPWQFTTWSSEGDRPEPAGRAHVCEIQLGQLGPQVVHALDLVFPKERLGDEGPGKHDFLAAELAGHL